LKILALYDSSGPKFHRVLLPVHLMDGVEFTLTQRVTEEQVKDIDILFFNRLIPGTKIQTILDWRDKYGFSIVIDFDDHWKLGPDHYLSRVYDHYNISAFMEAWINEADVVTVTHERLYSEVFPLNKNVHILPNAIPEFDQFLCKKIPSDFTRIFWAGGVTHKKDIALLREPIKRICTPAIQFVMAGYVAKNPEWAAMASAFTNGGRFNNELIEALPVESYYFSYSKCDIALIPLLETKFNSYKSNLKILEAANIGSPVVVSRVHPYLDFPEELVNYVDKQGDWVKQVKKLIQAPGQAKFQGEKLREYCKDKFNFRVINQKRKEIFQSLIKSKNESTATHRESSTLP
jgi:glycosyltransferase involved in cell wall biosynthesis